jgi:hypothetical protein
MRAFQLYRLAFLTALLTLALSSHSSWSKTFKTQFIKFELPPNWDCKQEEIDWVCQPDNLAERSEAMIVVVTKAVNEVDDNFPKYEEVLKTPRAMRDLLGNAYQSQVKYVRPRQIKGQQWVDALQLGSEIPGFYTRYVASIKDKVAGLITYSVAESVYPKYAPILDQMIDSVEIFFDPKAFAEAMNAGPTSLLGSRGAGLRGRFAPKIDGAHLPNAKKEGSGVDPQKIVGLLLILGVAGYFIYKKRRAS